ncbi:hypothetical protein EHQ53_10855 [Leptospira langatensis]|uniref:Uncharacterized protein n=1 Tax=Leptospira langatensis TaxID=2484983 RepID=A0A5F1ZS97_9LEPT|nr:hypothetical protein [Leptospira langatensis]TGJ98947.1 hypothetical protein EHO57_15645 [Leptospira langatensis]TGL40484.1 hypothetical protein EHQ53_10855 [Leptospira langatensis]
MKEREKAYLVFFPKDPSIRLDPIEDLELEKKGMYPLGFPYDCLVLSDSVSYRFENERIHLNEKGHHSSMDLLLSTRWVDTPIQIKLSREKFKGVSDRDLILAAAALGRYEEANRFLDLSSFLSLGYMQKYSQVKVSQLFQAQEIRLGSDGLRSRMVRLDSIFRSPILGGNRFGLLKKQNGFQKEFQEACETFLNSADKVSHIYEELKEKIQEKRFLFWGMIAEYTIVILISLELAIEVLDYFGK